MKRWTWESIGRRGGMVICEGPMSLSIQWPSEGGCVAQWWFGGRCVMQVSPGLA